MVKKYLSIQTQFFQLLRNGKYKQAHKLGKAMNNQLSTNSKPIPNFLKYIQLNMLNKQSQPTNINNISEGNQYRDNSSQSDKLNQGCYQESSINSSSAKSIAKYQQKMHKKDNNHQNVKIYKKNTQISNTKINKSQSSPNKPLFTISLRSSLKHPKPTKSHITTTTSNPTHSTRFHKSSPKIHYNPSNHLKPQNAIPKNISSPQLNKNKLSSQKLKPVQCLQRYALFNNNNISQIQNHKQGLNIVNIKLNCPNIKQTCKQKTPNIKHFKLPTIRNSAAYTTLFPHKKQNKLNTTQNIQQISVIIDQNTNKRNNRNKGMKMKQWVGQDKQNGIHCSL